MRWCGCSPIRTTSAAEFAIIVQQQCAGQGLGRLMMARILGHARARGISRMWGVTLRDNRRMRALARRLGFTQSFDPDDPGLVRMVLELGDETARPGPAADQRDS